MRHVNVSNWRIAAGLIAMAVSCGCEKAPKPIPVKKAKLEHLLSDPTIMISNANLDSILWMKMDRAYMDRILSGAFVGARVTHPQEALKLCLDPDAFTFSFHGKSGRSGWVKITKGCSDCSETYYWLAEFDGQYLEVPEAGVQLLTHYADSIKEELGISQQPKQRD